MASEIRHRRRVTACLSTINMILSDEDKISIQSLYFKGYTANSLTDKFPDESWTMVLISCSKSCGTQAQLTGGQALADRAVLVLKKTLSFFFRSSRSLPLTWFCRLSGDVTENTFLSVKKTKSVAYCGNFWSISLARFMRATQFAYVSSCARCLLKHYRCKSLKIIWDTDGRWISVSRDISLTVLWICGLSS